MEALLITMLLVLLAFIFLAAVFFVLLLPYLPIIIVGLVAWAKGKNTEDEEVEE